MSSLKKTVLSLLLTLSSAFSAMTSEDITPAFLAKKIKIFDIRTQGEWKSSGILKDSIPLTFFDERGAYNIEAFVSSLNAHIKKDETFALICASGSRTSTVANFLGKNGFNVINLKGGIMSAARAGIALTPYK